MNEKDDLAWYGDVSLRIAHETLDIDRVSSVLGISPQFAYRPGESRVHHRGSKSAGYWGGGIRIEHPIRPNVLFEWAESVAVQHEQFLRELLEEESKIDVYAGVFCKVMNVGFNLTPTPTLWRLGIPVGIEFYGR